MKTKKVLSLFLIVLLLFFLVTETEKVTVSVIDALKLCVSAVIPTLFPFFVVSGLLVNLGFVAVLGRVFMPVARFLFKTSGKGAVVFIIGIICGYPTGAKVIADMCRDKSLSKKESERLLAFCNNSGPLFIIGAVGTVMLGNHKLGVVLYIIHLLSAIFTGILLSLFAKNDIAPSESEICVKDIGTAVAQSIENAVRSILNVCGYVVFFSILCVMVKNVFLISILEVTTGAKTLIARGFDEKIMIILLSGAIGFGGICVMLQVQSAVAGTKISLRLYILGKIIQAIISMIIAFFYVNLFEVKSVFLAVNSMPEVSYMPLFIFILCGFLSLLRLTKKG